MILITTRDKIQGVANRWKKQYYQGNKWSENLRLGNARDIYQRLKVLPLDATAEMVAEIIGNGSWTELLCTECGKTTDAVVQLGDEPDYESSTVWICLECLRGAVSLLVEGL